MVESNRILVIDDDKGIRDAYKSILNPKENSKILEKSRHLFQQTTNDLGQRINVQYDVVFAENGTQGIQAVESSMQDNKRFALAFIDMKMPGLNGVQTTKKIWSIDNDIKIVIVTAFSEFSPEDINKETGRDDIFYLRKPFVREEITQFAKTLIYQRRLEEKRYQLEQHLKTTNDVLQTLNTNLEKKVKDQALLIVQAEKMATVGMLAAGIAHEINNPIAFVNGNFAALKKYLRKLKGLIEIHDRLEADCREKMLDPPNPIFRELTNYKVNNKIDFITEDLDQLIDESMQGTERVSKIVRDLNNFSRVDQADYKAVDINEAIETTLTIIWNELKGHVTLKKEYGALPLVKCFPQKMSQVFMNILINASQAIEGKGVIKITTKLSAKGSMGRDQHAVIAISDTGKGISDEEVKHIFDPFYTTKPEGKGTGLGLSIVYDIIKAHNGFVEVDSNVGNGSEFKISIPVCGPLSDKYNKKLI